MRDGRIVAVGDASAPAAGGDAQRIDCEGGVLLPAFIDAHCHLLVVRGEPALGRLHRRAQHRRDPARDRGTRGGDAARDGWIRAFGYEETSLAEGRHPDAARSRRAPRRRIPCGLIHRSGHASVLNSSRSDELGIDDRRPKSRPAASIERDLATGEPNGAAARRWRT